MKAIINTSTTTAIASLQDTVDLNNSGVSLLCTGGQNEVAISSLSTSLRMIKRFLAVACSPQQRRHRSTTSFSSSPYHGDERRHSRRKLQQQHQPLLLPTSSPVSKKMMMMSIHDEEQEKVISSSTPVILPADTPMLGLQSPYYFINNRGMQLVTVTSHGNTHTQLQQQLYTKNAPLYSACILLNLAMAYHCAGIEPMTGRTTTPTTTATAATEQSRRLHLFKAGQMYRCVLLVLPTLAVPSNTLPLSHRQTILSMKLVTLNNLAVLYQQQFIDNLGRHNSRSNEVISKNDSDKNNRNENDFSDSLSCEEALRIVTGRLERTVAKARQSQLFDGTMDTTTTTTTTTTIPNTFLSDIDIERCALNVRLWRKSPFCITAAGA